MESILPSRFSPAELARSGQSSHLTIPVSHFKRFSALLANDDGEVCAGARFFVGESGDTLAEGNLRTQVFITCQRCMEPAQIVINCQFKFAFLQDENSVLAVEDEYDPVLLDQHKEINAIDFLEDELILQVPLSLVHANEEDCDPQALEAAQAVQSKTKTKTHNPFSGLDELLKG